MEPWVELAKVFGPSVAFMAFMLFRDWKREDRMATALDSQQEQLMTLNTRGISAIEQNTASNDRLTLAIERLPCRAIDEVKDFTPPIRRKSGGYESGVRPA